jgi:putative transposase
MAKGRRFELSDEEWQRIRDLLAGKEGDPGVTADNRRFIEAVLWIARTGAPWRDLPERFGNWNSVFQRFNRWSQKGVWRRVMDALGGDADWEWLLLDSTVVRAHQHAAGARKKGAKRAPTPTRRTRRTPRPPKRLAARAAGLPRRYT